MSDDAELVERFAALWLRLGGGDWRPTLDAVLQGWREPHRSYHGIDHLRDCLVQLDESPARGGPRDLAEAALWYHDVVYQPGAADNEARSAELARAAMIAGGIADEAAREVARLVLLTNHSGPAPDPASALVCDVDLSILGRSVQMFAEYEGRIREEYRLVPEAAYRMGRARVLASFLQRESIYLTDHFHQRYEAAARRNLRRSLELLRADAST